MEAISLCSQTDKCSPCCPNCSLRRQGARPAKWGELSPQSFQGQQEHPCLHASLLPWHELSGPSNLHEPHKKAWQIFQGTMDGFSATVFLFSYIMNLNNFQKEERKRKKNWLAQHKTIDMPLDSLPSLSAYAREFLQSCNLCIHTVSCSAFFT